MTHKGPTFNPPPGWPKPPVGWIPPKGWAPDPAWPPPPPGWQLWVYGDTVESSGDSLGKPDVPSMVSVDATVASSAGAVDRVALLEAENVVLRARLHAVDIGAGSVVELNDDECFRTLASTGTTIRLRTQWPIESASTGSVLGSQNWLGPERRSRNRTCLPSTDRWRREEASPTILRS